MLDTELETWLRRRIAELARLGSGEDISVHEPLAAYGLSSIDAVALAGELGALLDRKVSPTIAYEYPTLREILDHLREGRPERNAAAAPHRAATGRTPDEPVAIIGMGCRFPGADGPEAFWELLERGGDAIGRVPDDRFARWGGGNGGTDRAALGGFLTGVGGLDLDFFGINEHEAAKLDPQQRLMLEVAWEAVEDAGIDPYGLAGSPTGVFIGISSSDYRDVLANSPSADAYSLLGGASSVAANRLSYLLDLRGPSLAVDTACSSSLVAVHLACDAIRRGECGVAIVGGVNVILTPAITEAFDNSGVMAPDGRCKTFSAQADGYVRSEGAGVVVLKPLSEALRDGDRVSAVIRGSAVTSDGRTNGLLAPSRRSQEEVVRQALGQAGARPREVGYVEAHGTGTAIGDQIEAAALGGVLNRGRAADRPCAIGSVKTNVGHLEAAAGIAGLIKLALCFEHGALPPSLHCDEPNPDIDFDGLGLRVQSSLRRWESPDEVGVVGVSSFGFGGTNAHAVLGPAPAATEASEVRPPRRPVQLLALSAATGAALHAQAADHAAWAEGLDEDEVVRGSAAATQVRGRSGPRGREVRAAFAFADRGELLARLREPFTAAQHVPDESGVVFVFPGQGAQWLGMGRALIESEPAFDLAVSRCEQAFAPHVDWSLREVLTSQDAAPLLERIDVVQPAVFAMQVGLAALFRSWGVRPAGVIGHSMGEVAAAHVSGALRLEDAARIICRRSALMMRHRGQGAMALVSLPVSDVRKALEPYGERLSLAAHNGPSTTIVSGETAAVDEFVAAMDAEGVFGRRVKVDVASHCALLEDLREDLLAELAGLSPRPSTAAFHSSLTGERFDTAGLDAAYWWRNLREPVLFADAVRGAGAAGHRVFLEMSPHPLLSVSVTECLEDEDRDVAAVPAMRRTDDRAPYESVAALFEAGCEIDWAAFHGGRPRAGTRLPSYPWQRQEHWVEPAGPRAEGVLVTGSLPVIRDHRVQERAIAPAAWMLDAALRELNPGRVGGYGLSDVLVTNSLAVAGDESRQVRVSRRLRAGDEPFLSVESRAAHEQGAAWEEHVSAGWSATGPVPAPVDPAAILLRCPRRVETDALYEHLAASGLSYGDTMRMVTEMWLGDKELLTRLAPPSPRTLGRPLPADVADGAMQSIAGLSVDAGASGTFVGFGYRRVDVFAPWSGPTLAHVRLRSELDADADTFDCDVTILAPEGQVLVEFTGVSLKRMGSRHSLRFFAVDARPQPRPAESAGRPGEVVLLTGDAERCAPLVEELRRGGATVSVAALPGGEEDGPRFLEDLPAAARLLVVEPEREAFLALLRSAAKSTSTARRELALVTGDVALPPLLRALEQETVSWSGRAIRVESDELATRELARDIAAELAVRPDAFCVRYRHGERTLPSLTPVEASAAPAELRPGGVYWITGGQGGLGSTLAVTLAREAGARVVLTGRRAEVDAHLEEAVDAAGGRLLYLQADVTDEAAVRRALDETLRRFGALHGVIHTAGVLDDALIESTSAERMHAITAPKERGARILIDAVAAEDLDFIVLFSSMASLFVTAGQGAYAAGNATLDALTGTVRSRRTPVRAINWGPWAELGMVADPRYQARLLESGLHPMSPEAGAEAFLKALAGTHLQLAVLDVRDEVADGLVARFNRGAGAAGEAAAARPRAAGTARGEGGAGSAAEFVRAELARALRRSPAEIDTSVRFDRLGIDSLLAVSLTRRIGARFGLELPATFMFNHRTVDAVGLHLEGLLAAGSPEPDARPDAPAATGGAPVESAGEITLDEAERHSTVRGYTVVAGPSGLDMRLQDVPVRRPAPSEVVIDVHAVGVNFIDVLASTGFHPFLSTPPFVPGHEVAGVVHAVGDAVEHVRPGDKVIALTLQGGYAARVTTEAYTVAPLPAGVSFTDSVAMLISGLTAIACLEREARVDPGDRVLIQAAAGATGTACVQLALHHGATVFGTASTEAKLEHLRALGVQYPINYVQADFADAVRELSPDQGLDLIVDSLSGDAVGRGLALLRPGGRFVEIGAAGVLDLAVNGRDLFMSSRSFCTVNVGALARDPSRLRPLMDRLVELIDAGVFRPAVGGVFPFEEAPQAITQLRNRANIGKFVITVS
ncbi:type I polyketide synthase [Streptomyces avidinii]|uniref:SDR family NAD(P)-dependent oxidoreductase n=1 Tax=Streptomyces avidinii TaxID=1895 RepID=UPI00386F97F1|nr:type I polyketide synthase [Streptomyces avidinii]